MAMALKHTVVIVTRNRERELRRLLDSLSTQTLVPDAVVVIDASDDELGLSSFWGDRRPALTCIYTQPSLPHQRNVGLEAASGDVITFFDDDAIPEPDFCEQMLHRFHRDEDCGIAAIGGVMTNPVLPSFPEWLLKYLFLLQTGKGKNRFRISGFPDAGQASETEEHVDFLSTTALSLRRECLEKVRFDEISFSAERMKLAGGRVFSEDIDFTARLACRYEIIMLPSARYAHHPSVSNREHTFTTQALYVYSLRVVSMTYAKGIKIPARLWALAGQGLINVLQTIRYADIGYIKGYIRAMKSPLN